MPRLEITPQAQFDLDDIWLYVASSSGSVDAGDRILDRLYASIRGISENPGIGHLREDLTAKRLRFFSVFSYLIVYREAEDAVEILRILHGAREVEELLD